MEIVKQTLKISKGGFYRNMKQKLGNEGRLLIPLQIRQNLGLKSGDTLNVEYDTDKNSIIITLDKPKCIICKSEDKLTSLPGQKYFVCPICKELLKKI